MALSKGDRRNGAGALTVGTDPTHEEGAEDDVAIVITANEQRPADTMHDRINYILALLILPSNLLW